jgi:hypothetical protein
LAVPTDRPVTTVGGRPVTLGSDGEVLPQADWKVSVFPISNGRPNGSQRKAVEAQRDGLKETVSAVLDAALFGEGDLVLKDLATPAAAKALARSHLRLPKGISEVQVVRREAKVGVDRKATHASAQVAIAFRAVLKEKPVRMLQRSTLWLEKGSSGWRLIAFSGEMGRVK